MGTLEQERDGLAAALNKQSWCECCPPVRNANPAACGRALPLVEESGEETLVPGAVMALPMQVQTSVQAPGCQQGCGKTLAGYRAPGPRL